MTNLVEIRDLKLSATTDAGRNIRIINNVSLDIAEGEIVALIGESGSGKTTIALSLMGYARPGCHFEAGSVMVGGRDMLKLSESERAGIRGTDVAYVPQSAAAAFNPAIRLIDQVIEVARIHKLMPAAQAREKAIELFRALALPEPETIGERYPHQVSGGQLQRLSAAMALIGQPRLMIFDEPTTALDVTTQIEVLRAFKSVMKDGGMAGVYVSHDLAVVAQIADRIIVLRGGEIQEEGATADILERPAHPYTQELLAAFHPAPHAFAAAAQADKEAPAAALEVRNIIAGYGPANADGIPQMPVLHDVSCRLEKGRNLGVIGESGCGKSSLARVMAGILAPASGSILLDGKVLAGDLRHRSKEELRRLQIVFQLADTALNPSIAIGNILGRPLTFYHGMKGSAREARIVELLDMVHLPASMRHRLPGELSGGQKQRINLARALAANPDVILCDEITSALDTVVAAAVIDLLKELQRELQLSYVFISHDLSTVQAICDDVVVMHSGINVETLPAANIMDNAQHPYTRLLLNSSPQLDMGWLDGLKNNPAFADADAAFHQGDA